MSNKFFWEGEDVSNLVNENTQSFEEFGYKNFPGQFVEYSGENRAGCYASEESGPPFYYDNKSIFSQSNNDNERIRVKRLSFTDGSGSTNIPTWCNAVKVHICSKKGESGTGVEALNKDKSALLINYGRNWHHDDNYYNNYENHKDTLHYHVQINNYDGESAYNGGSGGKGKNVYITKWVTFNAGNNNTIVYNLNNTSGGTSSVIIKESDVQKLNFTVTNGADGKDATAATIFTDIRRSVGEGINNNEYHTTMQHIHADGDNTEFPDGEYWFTHAFGTQHHNFDDGFLHHNMNLVWRYKSASGSHGADGANGTFENNSGISNVVSEDVNNTDIAKIYVYCFKKNI